jgi:hypothetical protein
MWIYGMKVYTAKKNEQIFWVVQIINNTRYYGTRNLPKL